ncbi:TOMM precursor leader peptide-binding protein [Alicyclobacillus curvatus]|nr:TOMM precursor leader peptide-binding protein [Alicyclobacillus curvatus]
MFGQGVAGPLVTPGTTGCSECADLRLLMADTDRHAMFKFKMQFSSRRTAVRDTFAGRSGLRHLATILAAEVRQVLSGGERRREEDWATAGDSMGGDGRATAGDSVSGDGWAADGERPNEERWATPADGANTEDPMSGGAVMGLSQHVLILNLQTLDASRHFILPDGMCPVCGWVPDDSAEAAVVSLQPTPKPSLDGFRTKSLSQLDERLECDYLDYNCGLFNGKAQDLITPFAAVSVNLPLLVGNEGTSGRSDAYDECEWIAILEGLERYCGLQPRGKRTVVYDSYANLKHDALNPITVGLHAPEQYERSDFPFERYHPDAEFGWVWGYSLTADRPILVPERLAYYSLGRQGGFVYETSNGCALGGSLVEAIFHGILEVVERDAFLMTWYAKLPLPRIDMTSTTDVKLQWMIDRIRTAAGYDLHFYNATMENNIPTVFVVAKNRRTHGLNLLCSAGAHVDPMRAIKSAVHETAGMLLRFDEKLAAHRDAYLKMLADSTYVRGMEDHSMLYGLPEAEPRLSFLLEEHKSGLPEGRQSVGHDGRRRVAGGVDGHKRVQELSTFLQSDSKNMDLTDDLKDLLAVFRKLKQDVIVVNQTSPEIQKNGLYCVKVLIPGMLPMTFGHHLTRLEHLDRVIDVPMQLGYLNRRLTRADINPFPHPFP